MIRSVQEIEEEEFTVTSDAEWDRAGAAELGAHRPECAWILSDRDVWYRNPSYRGPPQPHPDTWEDEVT